jgi:hypothetical protein
MTTGWGVVGSLLASYLVPQWDEGMMHVDRFILSILLLPVILSISDPPWASSKHLVPELDAQDLLSLVPRKEQPNDSHIYLFSTLTFINIPKDATAFEFSKAPSPYLLPTLAIHVYPAFDILIQSEFFDFTIWGQLGNHFNKNIELIELENQIISLLMELDTINRRYQNIFSQNPPKYHQVDKLASLYKHNYLKDAQNDHQQGASTDQSVSHTKKVDDIRKLISDYENQPQLARLNSQIHPPMIDQDAVAAQFSIGAYMHSSDLDRALGSSSIEVGGTMIRFLRQLSRAFKYLFNNKLESIIYLLLLLLLTTVIKALFVRS